ncbi:MAG: SDR family NAD(P)-dependent oxidoreductase [Acidobacteria bacterium]|nr:SDR family NAD(P)-dependent oxidoreductase [Acidobacteriota bacterium]
MEFRDQIAFVTGSSSGIGREIALALARQGAHIAGLACSWEKLQALKRDIQVLDRRCLLFAGDVCDRDFVFDCVRHVEQDLGAVDILVNNAGMGVGGAVYEVPLQDIQDEIDVNFYGVIHSTHAVLPKMMERRHGLIINISSVAGKVSIPYSGYYCATKFALTALSDAWRLELRPFGIHVLNVCPGTTSGTAFHERVRGVRRPLRVHYEMSAEQVARRTVAAAAVRKREIILTAGGRLYAAANRFAPGLTYYLLSKVVPYLVKRSENKGGLV